MDVGEQVDNVNMLNYPCFASDYHNCTITQIVYHGSLGSQLTLTCNICGRIKYVNNPERG